MTQRLVLEKLLDAYGLQPVTVLDCQRGYRNRSYPVRLEDSRLLNLILYKSDADMLCRIKNANAVSNYLAARGLLVRHTADPRILVLHTPNRAKYAALYNYLPGATIPWEAYTRRHLKLLGATMSELHAALQPMPQDRLPLVTSEYQTIAQRMRNYFSQSPVRSAAEKKLGLDLPLQRIDRLEFVLNLCTNLAHQQPLHMDFVRSNILFQDTPDGPEISGIIDFEKTAFGHPVFDIARTLAFLLVDSKHKNSRQVHKYFLQSGYNKRGAAKFQPPIINATAHCLNLLEELTDLFLTYDFYKFLRHNPYESLAQNEHFVRTKDLLLARGLLKCTPYQIKRGLQPA